jgi:nitroimidazol reductase NimA-like FMN-containing flavoprotein (pyridoxamine 5'-phosphate oxidase superfamily)
MTNDDLKRLEQSELIKLIDEGRLVYLSYKVGDIVYLIERNFNFIYSAEILKLVFNGVSWSLNLITKNSDMIAKVTLIGEVSIRSVFATRKQAERALKEMEGK